METISQQTVKDLYRIVLYGPESTGKTSLAQGLAAHFKTQWVPEFARTYLQEKWEREQAVCTAYDLLIGILPVRPTVRPSDRPSVRPEFNC